MIPWLLGTLLGGVWIASGTWILLPKDLRRVAMRPPRLTWVTLALIATAYLLGGVLAGSPLMLVVPVAVLACPAVLLLGMAQTMKDRMPPRATPGSATAWTVVVLCVAGLGIAGLGWMVFAPIVWISAHAGLHVLAFARGWRTPWNDRALASISFGLAVFWMALPVTHAEFDIEDPGVSTMLADLGVTMPGSFPPGCRTGFPFARVFGATNAAASEYLPLDRGLSWMFVNAGCCVGGAWVALLPVPSRMFRDLVFPALVSAAVCAVAGIAYMLYILD